MNRRIKALIVIDAVMMFTIIAALIFSQAPDPVSGLEVKSSSYSSLDLGWKASEKAGEYQIYRSTDGKDYKYISSTETNHYTDSNLKTGKDYYYLVRAKKGFRTTELNNKQAVNASPQLDKPEFTVDTSNGRVELKIAKVDGAEGYEIIKDGKKITESYSTMFIDDYAADGKDHKYEVRALRYRDDPVYGQISSAQTVEIHSLTNFKVETADDKLLLDWDDGGFYKKYKIYNGSKLLTETSESEYSLNDYKLQQTYDIKVEGLSEDGKTKSPQTGMRFQAVEEPMSTEAAIEATIQWAMDIADDNSFHYGNGPGAHHEGCYFCGTQSASRKKGVVNYEKTYCCNPFIHAAFSHGCKEPSMLKRCKQADSFMERDYKASPVFDNLGRPSRSELKRGDVLCCNNGHVMIYLGDGTVIESSNGDEGKPYKGSWNKSISVRDLTDDRWNNKRYGVCGAYRYIGHGGSTMISIKQVDEKGKVIDGQT